MQTLVQFGDLSPAHFAKHPVWAACHSFDHDQPWYDETDEETFRPHTEDAPVNPTDGMYLISARFRLADGSSFKGFITPAQPKEQGDGVLGLIQPQMYLPSGERVGFWLGMFGESEGEAARLYAALGRDASSVFPISFSADETGATGIVTGTIAGFYTVPDGSTVHVAM
jgi:hypothetical protein